MTLEKMKASVSFAFHFFKLFVIIRTNGTHQPVPEEEVEAIIAFEILVVHIMIDRGIDPFAEPVLTESFRV